MREREVEGRGTERRRKVGKWKEWGGRRRYKEEGRGRGEVDGKEKGGRELERVGREDEV